MCEVKEKIAYLSGLKDGMKLEDKSAEKLFAAVIDALTAMADHIQESDDFVDEIAENVDLMGDELDEVEDFLDELCEDFDDEDDDDDCCDCDDDCCDCDCDCDDEDCLELDCPFCNEPICFDADLFVSGDELRCPCCDKVIFEEE